MNAEATPVMVKLEIRLLGEFALFCDGQPVTAVDSARQQSLLAYLVLHGDAPQARQHLAFLFWPDSNEAQARTNLRNLLHTLARDLPGGERFICTEGQTVQWCGGAEVRVDVNEFRAAVQQARAGGGEQAIGCYRQAMELYRGDLLPGNYDDWAAEERERLREEYGDALQELVGLLERAGEPRAAIAYAGRLVRHDPLREETCRRLFRLYWQCGDRGGIKRAYRDCEARLRAELDVEPSPETRLAYEKYLRKELPAGVAEEGDNPCSEAGQAPANGLVAADRVHAATRPALAPAAPPAQQASAPGVVQPASKWSQESRRRVKKHALFALNVAAPLGALGALVFLAQVPLELAAGASALLYAGLYLVINHHPGQEAHDDNVAAARDRLAASRQCNERTRRAAGGLPHGEQRERALHITELTGAILDRLAAEQPLRLPPAARMERITGETGGTLDAYLQIERGELHASAARLAELRNDIAKVLGLIETSLLEIAVSLDEKKMTELEVRVHVLKHTQRDEGLD